MNLTARTQTNSRHRLGRIVRAGQRSQPHRSAAPAPTAQPRSKRHGGPSEDRALYACTCGYAFKASVSTSVGCPHCGRTQAW